MIYDWGLPELPILMTRMAMKLDLMPGVKNEKIKSYQTGKIIKQNITGIP